MNNSAIYGKEIGDLSVDNNLMILSRLIIKSSNILIVDNEQ
jgi:hypothetical protein